MKKTLALILALVLLVSLVGCSTTPTTPVNNGEDQTPPDNQQEEPKDVTWMLVEYSTVKYNNHLEIYQKLEEAGNIKLNILPTPIDAYVDKFSIMMAASEKPDVMSVYGEGVYNTVKDFGPKGMFVPISDHLDQMPNLAKWLEKYESSLPAVTAGDGKLYCMPKVKDYDPIYTGLVMRTDLLEKGGFDVSKMETVDDLYRAFEILKEQNDGRAPFSGRFGLGNLDYFAQIFGTAFKPYYYDFEADEYINPIATPNCKAAVEYFANMVKDGLLHPDWASMSDQDWNAKVNSGELTAYVDNMQNTDNYIDTNKQKDPNFAGKMEGILPPTYEGKRYVWGMQANLATDWAPAINAQSDAVDNILKAWDFFYDDANYDWLNYGEEGITCEKSESGDYWVYKDNRSDEVLELITDQYGIGQNENFYTVMKEDTFFSWPFMGKDNLFQAAVTLYGDQVYTELDPRTLIQFTMEETETLKNIQNPLDTLITENITKFINGVRPMSEWDQFVGQVESMNVQSVVDVYNAGLSRVGQ